MKMKATLIENTEIFSVHCCECRDPIPEARLKAKPDAARCIDCQLQFEFEQKQKLNLRII